MAKRKLSKQQSNRVAKQQQQVRDRAGKGGKNKTDNHLDHAEHGLLVARFSRHGDVEDENGNITRCHFRANLGHPVTGDRVIFSRDARNPKKGVIEALEPRESLLERPDSQGNLRPVAANLNQLLIVIAPQPEPHHNLIDRYIVAAEHAGLSPVLILNKSDLEHSLDNFLQEYRNLDYPVVEVSAHSGHRLEQLQALLKGHASAFVGQSGVGKSSLINELLPHVDADVGALSEATAKGTHTTTTSRLYHLPEGGDLIDSPGIREFSLEHLPATIVYEGFRELKSYLGECRFRDCRHQQEPDCAVRDAIEAGKISSARLESLRYILGEAPSSADDTPQEPI
ncbi:MAG: small ribosomal subunit biogenesis GTPase RsgA [Cellvibrionaceae bacterium]